MRRSGSGMARPRWRQRSRRRATMRSPRLPRWVRRVAEGAAMRLDRFLWFARFARTRSAAQALAEDGHLRISGRPATSRHAPVRVGDVLTFVRGAQVSVVRVEALPLRRGPAPDARASYTDLTSPEAGCPAPAVQAKARMAKQE